MEGFGTQVPGLVMPFLAISNLSSINSLHIVYDRVAISV